MTLAMEISLKDFEFWSGAVAVRELITDDEMDMIEGMMEELQFDWTATEINDMFWFDSDMIAEWLGYSSFDEMWEERHE